MHRQRKDAGLKPLALHRQRPLLLFADEIATAAWAHASGVGGSGGNVAAVAYRVGMGFAIHGQGHFSIEDDVGGETRVCVIRIEGVRAVLPNKRLRKALGFETLL